MLTTRIGRLTTLLILISLGLVEPCIVVAQDSEATYEERLTSAKSLLRLNRYDEAIKAFRSANEMREKKSAECYALMSDAYLSMEAYKNVIAAADKSIALAGSDAQLLLTAYNNKGLALMAQANKKDQTKLMAAEEAFREALKLKNASPVLHY